MADLSAGKFKAMFNRYGCDVRVDMTHEYATSERKGRSDCIVTLQGRSVFVEFKYGEDKWVTRSADGKHGWTQQQRDYAQWAETENGTLYWIGLMVGSDPPHYNPAKYEPERAYLIPYIVAKIVVTQSEPYSNSIPYRIRKGGLKVFREMNMSCETRFKDFVLEWKDGGWHIPETHMFHQHIERR